MALAKFRHRHHLARFDVAIAAGPAFGMGVPAEIMFDGDHQLGTGLKSPHHIEQIAAVSGAQFEPELVP